jgi:hypothetical protein
MNVRQRRWALCCVLLIIGTTGCSGTGSSDAGTAYKGVCFPSAGSTGNEHHVGAYCTKGGDQCSKFINMDNAAVICAIDVDPQGGNFCIKIGCSDHATCGESACCTGREGQPIHACIPLSCVSGDSGVCPPIPGLGDGGMGD